MAAFVMFLSGIRSYVFALELSFFLGSRPDRMDGLASVPIQRQWRSGGVAMRGAFGVAGMRADQRHTRRSALDCNAA